MTNDVAAETDLAVLLRRVTRAAICLLPASAAMISLIRNDGDEVAAASGVGDQHTAASALPVIALAWNGAAAQGDYEPIVIPDVRRLDDEKVMSALLEAGLVALVVVPLLSGEGERIGALAVADAMPRRWVTTDVEALADVAAIVAAAVTRQLDAASRPAHELAQADVVAQLRRGFDDGQAGHAIATADGAIIACNIEFVRIAGLASIEQVIGSNLRSLQSAAGTFHTLLERLEGSGLISWEELPVMRADGRPARVLATVTAGRDAEGSVNEIRVYLVDITHRVQSEAAQPGD